MRHLPLLVLVFSTACFESDPATDSYDTDGSDGTDSETEPPIELPFEVGTWSLDFLDPEIDLCGYGAVRPQTVTIQAGGKAFEVVMDGPAPGPLTYDCTLDEMSYECAAPGQFRLSGSFLSTKRAFGNFVDDNCGSTFPFSAEMP